VRYKKIFSSTSRSKLLKISTLHRYSEPAFQPTITSAHAATIKLRNFSQKQPISPKHHLPDHNLHPNPLIPVHPRLHHREFTKIHPLPSDHAIPGREKKKFSIS
jgi:hypothetical protein